MEKTIKINSICTYSTSELVLAAAISLYYPIFSIDKSNPQKIVFIFKKDEDFDLILERYWGGDLRVEPKLYYHNLKILKSRIYERV